MEHIVAVIDEGMIFDFPRMNLMDLDDISRTLEFIFLRNLFRHFQIYKDDDVFSRKIA